MPAPQQIVKMSYGGNGITEAGAAVPFVLSGEFVEITSPNGAHILESSPDRVPAPCIHFGTCGGCHYQHASYPAQLAIKRVILQQVFFAAGLSALPAIDVHSAKPWHYRNRVRMRVGMVDGELRVGYNRHNAGGGDPLLPIMMCPIATPLLWHAAATLVDHARTQAILRNWLTSAIELELFTNSEETALQMTLFTRAAPPDSFSAFCESAVQIIPQLTGAGVAILPRKPSPQGRRFERSKLGAQWGKPGLIYKVDGEAHWVSRGAFFQVNRHLLPRLRELATSGRAGVLAWDLYAGVGLFSRELTKTFTKLIAVEAGEPAVTDLAAALKSRSHRAVSMTTLDFLQAAVVQRERPDLIVMDPPRAGLGPEVCNLLGRIRCPEFVNVSCDPVTLARDLKQLTGEGYNLTELHLVDMFPQTFHMETVAILRR